MKKELAQQYAFKVTQANRTQLVVIMYDILLEEIKEAREAYQAGDLTGFTKELKLAQKYVVELMDSSNLANEVGREMYQWYKYINGLLIKAMIQQKEDVLIGIDDIVGKFRSAFDTISKQDYSGTVMAGTEQVYAGFTYSKGKLDETYLDGMTNNGKRGFTI